MKNQNSADVITVTGKAINLKAGAIVVTDDRQAYYIDGLSHWAPQFLNERVEVKGDLIQLNKIPKSTPDNSGARTQGSTATSAGSKQFVIKNASWKLAD